MPDPSTRSLVKVVRASLKLANNSVEFLNTSQLLAIQAGLRETLRITNGKIQERQSSAEHGKVVIDLSDFEDDDTDDAADEEMETASETDGPLPVPGPYPTVQPPAQEIVDAYYVVDHGREVGIFTDSVLSTHAISGIPRGHQVEVNTWYDAATLYNSLLDQGLITRVRM